MNSDEQFPPTEVSILMTAFNAEAHLAEAFASIASQQTHRSWELVFVDDGSTDGTLDVARCWQSRFGSSMRILQHPQSANAGISASRNLALRHARGTLLTFLDADDVWLPHHMETQASVLDNEPDVAMAYAAAERWVHFDRPFDETRARAAAWGDNYLPPLVPTGTPAGVLPRGLLLEWFRKDESMVPCICTVMVRTWIARAVGGFCDEFRGLYDDQVFHAKVSTRFQVFANNVCTARYRQHPVSCCAQARTNGRTQQTESNRFERFLRSAHLRDSEMRPAHMSSTWTLDHIQGGDSLSATLPGTAACVARDMETVSAGE